jgi:hypothetical protein
MNFGLNTVNINIKGEGRNGNATSEYILGQTPPSKIIMEVIKNPIKANKRERIGFLGSKIIITIFSPPNNLD